MNTFIYAVLVRIFFAAIFSMIICAAYFFSHKNCSKRAFFVRIPAAAAGLAILVPAADQQPALWLIAFALLICSGYRIEFEDIEELLYYFWAVTAGLACGAGRYLPAAIGSAAVFIILLLLRAENTDKEPQKGN